MAVQLGGTMKLPSAIFQYFSYIKYLFLTELEVCTVSYKLSFYHLDLRPKHEVCKPQIQAEKTKVAWCTVQTKKTR